ncbi:hypothetical protein MWN52_15160 [Pseudoxanthomonas winnipegensis]|uniref:hypothetical protein n=1 Tax=Pseudoxanthomonas winnipegensis TaxID=2480810 RepID=UPI002578D3E7|nr:hypothetical protein [Pseudoxanthomonas winnipegensis]WJI14949.1 hypothetical protein MWN52_15160 [Pseudoxanthomonas winnipegensis]
MADLAQPLVFNLARRADRERFARLYHNTDAGLSQVYWRLFEEVASTWKLEADVLDWYRRRLQVVVDRLDACCLALGGPHNAMRHMGTNLHMQAAQGIVESARNAYAVQVGQAIIRGRAAGGRAKERPEWWDPMVKHAKLLLTMGHSPRDVVGICARGAPQSETAIRRMLQREGVLRRSQPGAK